MCQDSMLLHGIDSQDFEPIVVFDSLAADPGDRFDLVLTNPPFGKKSTTTIVGDVAPAIHGSHDNSASMHVICGVLWVSLDIFWLKDDSLADSDNLPAPDVIAADALFHEYDAERRLTADDFCYAGGPASSRFHTD